MVKSIRFTTFVINKVVDSESAKYTALKEAYDDLADKLVSITIEQF